MLIEVSNTGSPCREDVLAGLMGTWSCRDLQNARNPLGSARPDRFAVGVSSHVAHVDSSEHRIGGGRLAMS